MRYSSEKDVYCNSNYTDRAGILMERINSLQHVASKMDKSNFDFSGKPNIHIFTYASDRHWRSTIDRLSLQINRSELFSTFRILNPRSIRQWNSRLFSFFEDIFSLRKGAGYWIWKIIALDIILSETPINDFVFYLDAGSSIFSNGGSTLKSWLRLMEAERKEILTFSLEDIHKEKIWCNSRVFESFQCLLREKEIPSVMNNIVESPQICSTAFLGRNGPELRKTLIMIYEVLLHDKWIITDRYNHYSLQSVDGFKDNRHDQCLFSITWKILQNSLVIPYPDETNHENVVSFTRYRKNSFLKSKLREWIFYCVPRNKTLDTICDRNSKMLHLKNINYH
jgi:hypothetical protein